MHFPAPAGDLRGATGNDEFEKNNAYAAAYCWQRTHRYVGTSLGRVVVSHPEQRNGPMPDSYSAMCDRVNTFGNSNMSACARSGWVAHATNNNTVIAVLSAEYLPAPTQALLACNSMYTCLLVRTLVL